MSPLVLVEASSAPALDGSHGEMSSLLELDHRTDGDLRTERPDGC